MPQLYQVGVNALLLQEVLKLKDPPEPVMQPPAADAITAAGEMYFTKPEQLLQVYSDLEESNLFLIQVSGSEWLTE